MKYVLLSLLVLIGCSKNTQMLLPATEQNIIYDQDTREDISASGNLLNQSRATALLIRHNRLTTTEHGAFKYSAVTLGDTYPLCSDEKFKEQPMLGFCSGVLIAENKVLTAAHCLVGDNENSDHFCKTTTFTFGWNSQHAKSLIINQEDIYSCARVVKNEYNPRKGLDYAIVELDRPVPGVKPIVFSDDEITAKKEVTSLSYPLGLPLKKDNGFVLQSNNELTFRAAVDTFAGSSGSPLFNTAGDLLGILIRGHDDIHEDELQRVQKEGGCLNFQRCEDGNCYGETYMKASAIEI